MGLVYDWEDVLRWDLQDSEKRGKLERKLELLRKVADVDVVRFHLKGTTDDHNQESHRPGGIGARNDAADEALRQGEVTAAGGNVNGISQIGNVPINEWQQNHGISEAVMLSRGYAHYDRSDEEGMDGRIDEAYGSSQAAMTQMRNASAQASGIIMTREAVPGSPMEEENTILPQTRPDEKIISAANMTKVRQVLRKEGIVGKDSTDAEIFEALDNDPDLKKAVLNDFGAKYLFPAGEGNAGRVDLNPGPGGENAERFLSGEGRVYLAMEGSLKTDSMISSVLRDGDLQGDASVIGVPSVTLWNHAETEWVARNHLQGREVVLVPDADGITNPAVINQARALQSRLEGLGAGKVIVASPPLGEADSIQEVGLPGGGKEKLKGVDDFLGAGRGSLDGLSFVDRQVSLDNAEVNRTLFESGVTTKAGIETTKNALRAVSMIAGPSGEVRLGSRSVGAAIGRDQKNALRAMEQLERAGLVKRENLYDMTPGRTQELVDRGVLPRVQNADGSYSLNTKPETITMNGGEIVLKDELKAPVYTIVNPSHRAVDSAPAFLGDLSGRGDRIVRTPEGAARYGVPIGAAVPTGGEGEG